MPYSIGRDAKACPASKPHAVKNSKTGAVVPGGCHETHDKALRHQRALTVNVEDAAAVAGDPSVREVVEGLVRR